MKRIFFLITLVIFFVGLISPLFVFAADPVKFCPQVSIPGIPWFQPVENCKEDGHPVGPDFVAKMTAAIYKFIVGLAAIAAVIVMMAGGYMWLFAGGNASKVGEAKSLIGSAVFGLFLALGSFMILNLINPKLVELKSLIIEHPKGLKIGEVKRICTKDERVAALKDAGKDASLFQCGSIYYPKYKLYTKCIEDAKTDKNKKCNPDELGAFEDGCIDVTCPNPYMGDYICAVSVQEIDGKAVLTGGSCVDSLKVDSGNYSINNVAIGSNLAWWGTQKPCGTFGDFLTDEISYNCKDESETTSCAVITLNGTVPIIENGHIYGRFPKKESKFKMACRDQVKDSVQQSISSSSGPSYGWKCGTECKISKPVAIDLCGDHASYSKAFAGCDPIKSVVCCENN